MKKITIQISFPTEKLEAVRHYAADRDTDLNRELEDALQRLYEKYVSKDVRAFLEAMEQKPTGRPPRPDRPVQQQNPPPEHSHSQP